MTCQHVPIVRETYHGLTAITCKACGHKWRECSEALTPEEYDGCVLMLAAYHLGRGQPDDPSPA